MQSGYVQNKFLLESSRSVGGMPGTISYNGLAYTYVQEFQMFVNQYGHMISPQNAAAFAEMADFDEVTEPGVDTGLDGGRERRNLLGRTPILAFAWSWPYDNGSDSTTVQSWIDNATIFEYVSPLVFITRYQANDDWKNGIDAADKNAAYTRLKALPAGKRAIQPYSFAYTYWNFNSEGLSGSSASSTMFNNDGTSGVCSGIYANLWATNGLSLGRAAWQTIVQEIGNTGASIDWLFADVEAGYELFSPFTVRGITGLTGAFFRNSNYTQSWYGVTSLSAQMAAEGACIGNISLSPAVSTDYVIWSKSVNTFTTALLNKVLWEPTIENFPNVQGSNYAAYNSGSSFDSPRDLNGHSDYNVAIFGSACAPVLYGVIGQLATAWSINPSDPTRILFGATSNAQYMISRSPWNSFLLDVQNIRSIKRNSPNTPITPWIASVKYAGVYQAGVSEAGAPPVGYADVTAGYNSDIGYTFGSAGNSAYYYEMIRHTSLYGTKAFGYWNYSSLNIGLTAHISLLNSTFNEVNTNLGGYTTQTADSTALSWLSQYVASGAPKPDGSYLWRVTVKPGLTLLANGITLSSSSGTVGTWITTDGPSLSGVGLTFI